MMYFNLSRDCCSQIVSGSIPVKEGLHRFESLAPTQSNPYDVTEVSLPDFGHLPQPQNLYTANMLTMTNK